VSPLVERRVDREMVGGGMAASVLSNITEGVKSAPFKQEHFE